jgi:hypothetical protein
MQQITAVVTPSFRFPPPMVAPSIVLDLRFKVIRPDQEVFIVFPGRGYFLYPFFVSNKRIFPELPGLDLIPKIPIEKQADLDLKLLRSHAIDAWYSSGRHGDLPSRRLSDYAKGRSPKWLPNARAVLVGFFGRAKKGDLVVVPPASIFENVLIGELLDDPEAFEDIVLTEIWDREKVPSRAVRWLARIRRGDCSLDLQRRFPSPNTVRVLDREARAEIYSLAYGSYSIADSFTSRFDVTSPDFSTRDDYHLQQFFSVVAALSQQGEIRRKTTAKTAEIGAKTLDDIIDLLSDDAYVPVLSININSPGSLVLSCAKVVPLVAAGVLALSLLGAEPTWQAVAQDKVTIKNSQTPDKDDPCTAQVALEILGQIKLMGYERWQETCKKAQQLQKNNGLNGNSKAEKK